MDLRSNEISLFGYQISYRGIQGDAKLAKEYIASGQSGRYMACANPHSLVIASKDATFKAALQNADILVPDGAGIVMSARLLHLPIKERVTGTDFFLALSEGAERNGGLKYFFLGSREHVLKTIRQRLCTDYPSIEVCGTYSPPYKEEFDDEDNKVMVDLINKARPDVLWVGMTAPKQEKWIFLNRNRLHVPLTAAIGAVFDFYAGTVKRPSVVWQKLGLEWLGRLLKEPRRLWKRNMVSMPIFVFWVLRGKIRMIFGEKLVC